MRRGIATACNTIYWLALTVWVGALIAAGTAAAATFRILPSMDLILPRFRAFPGDEHGRIAAGMVMEPLFTFVDVVQIAAAAIVVTMVAIQWLLLEDGRRRLLNLLRVACVLLAAALLAYRAVAVTPDMNRDLRAYWAAAEAGDVEVAAAHRADFDAAHGGASDLFAATLALLVAAVLASPAALEGRARPRSGKMATLTPSRGGKG